MSACLFMVSIRYMQTCSDEALEAAIVGWKETINSIRSVENWKDNKFYIDMHYGLVSNIESASTILFYRKNPKGHKKYSVLDRETKPTEEECLGFKK